MTMRVEQMIPVKRIRKSLPKTVDALQSRLERIGSGVADRFQSVAHSDAVTRARKAIRRGSDETMKWVQRNPKAVSLAGVGLGGALATWMLVRARRTPRRSILIQRAMKVAGNLPGVRRGFAVAVTRLIGWALTPRKPHVFRAISVRW
jgi:hypothetical protein